MIMPENCFKELTSDGQLYEILKAIDEIPTGGELPEPHNFTHFTGGSDPIAPEDIDAVPEIRTITAGTGLTGGGDLTANRAIQVLFGTTAGTVCEGNDPRLSPKSYGAFYDTTDQPFVAVGTPQVVTINSQYIANGVSIVDGSKITVANLGVYSLSFSLQVVNPDNAVHSFDCWLKYNGNNYPNSTTRFDMPARKSSGQPSYVVANFELTVMEQNAGDYVEIYWHANSTQLSLQEFPAQISPAIPETPSVIINVHQIA
jgi:hypothetical protein